MAQFLGQVVGTKMNKTVKVCVTSLQLHPVILKYWNHKKVYFAHDENNECRDGDYVLIKESRKLSKKKWFRVIDVVEKAPVIDASMIEETKQKPRWLRENLKLLEKNSHQSLKNITEKAKKEAKIVNKRARKVLATEDGGKLRDEYVLTVNLDAGHDLFKLFQENWVEIHQATTENAKKSQVVEDQIVRFTKECHKCNEYINEFHGNLAMLSEVITQVEMAHKTIDIVGEQCVAVEELLVRYEDIIQKESFEEKKEEMKADLSHLVESKHAEYSFRKSLLEGKVTKGQEKADGNKVIQVDITSNKTVEKKSPKRNIEEKQHLLKRESVEKQKAYSDAFLDQMNRYIQYGELEKPIAGSLNRTFSGASIEDDLQIDENDLSSLKEFLGPEVIDVLEASQNKNSSSTDVKENEAVTHLLTTPEEDITEKLQTDSFNPEKVDAPASVRDFEDNQKSDEVDIIRTQDISSSEPQKARIESDSDKDDAYQDCQE